MKCKRKISLLCNLGPCQTFFCNNAQVVGWHVSKSPTLSTASSDNNGSGANTCMHKSKQFLVEGHPVGPEDYKKSKKYKNGFSVKI